MSDDRVTTGEIYRLCQRIEEKVDITNGRVRKLEEAHIRIKTIWSLVTISALVFGDSIKRKLGF